MKSHEHRSFIPAMGHAALTPLYDPVARVIARDRTFKRRLVEHLGLAPGQRILDVGCGTGTLAILIADASAEVAVTGIDVDADILERARRKAEATGARVRFRVASATELPFEDGAFDRVTSTVMAHHLATPEKRRMLAEIRRVLSPDGELHLVDVGPARSAVGRALQTLLRPHVLADNLEGRLPALMAEAGFADVTEEDRFVTALGPLVFWRARGGAPSTT